MSKHHENGAVATRRSHRSLLAPVAYDELVMPSLRLARSSRTVRRIAKILLFGLILLIVVMAIAPWQQSITGQGNVVAYSAGHRQQTIESPIKGVLVRWGEGVYENARVSQGQLIAEIRDLDRDLIERLNEQLAANERQLQAATQQLTASKANLHAAQTVVEAYFSQIAAYTEVKQQVIASAGASVDMAKQKIAAEEQNLIEQQAGLAQVQLDFERQKQLYEEGIASQLKYQETERKLREAEAKVAKAEAYVEAAKNELISKERDRDAKAQKAQIDIDYANALHRKSQGDVAKAESEIAKSEADVTKVEKEITEMRIKLARQQNQQILAPFDGYVVQITPNQGGQLLKEGDMLCMIVPDTDDRAVQLWLDGNDASLINLKKAADEGTNVHVRLQFEGWPAVQWVGWPSVAVGTFGGKVVSVDAIDNGKGQYRVLVLPDEQVTDWPGSNWPEGRFLRQGVRANGWVLLERVPLWYEVWRRMNAFPPAANMDAEKAEKVDKPPKVGKPL